MPVKVQIKAHLKKDFAITKGSSTATIEPKVTTNALAPVRQKFELCKNWRDKGHCKYGEKCLFAHGTHELSNKMATLPTPSTSNLVETPTLEMQLSTKESSQQELEENGSQISNL